MKLRIFVFSSPQNELVISTKVVGLVQNPHVAPSCFQQHRTDKPNTLERVFHVNFSIAFVATTAEEGQATVTQLVAVFTLTATADTIQSYRLEVKLTQRHRKHQCLVSVFRKNIETLAAKVCQTIRQHLNYTHSPARLSQVRGTGKIQNGLTSAKLA